MYNVSDSFRTSMKQPAQHRRLYGTIGSVQFSQKNILQGTFTITNQCSDDTNIQIGQVYVGELKATFRNLNISRNNYKGVEIVPYNGLQLNDGHFEDVILGHYYIDSADWTLAGVEVIAYDDMSKFDKSILLSSSQGTVYDYVMMACKACGVTCNMTENDFAAFPNGSVVFSMYNENDMETWRDLISWCAQTIGANATINREGLLVFKSYNQSIVDTFTSYERLEGGKVSDFSSYYTGLSVVNIEKQITEYYGAEQDDGLTMNLGQNPLLQYGSDEEKEKQRRDILSAIMCIDYVPATMRLNTPMVYDLMDVIELSGGLVGDDEPIKMCITKYTWNFNGSYEISCVGANPALISAKSKVDKNIAGLMSQVSKDGMYYYDYINASKIKIDDGNIAEIISFRYASSADTRISFNAEVNYKLTLSDGSDSALLKVKYLLDGAEITDYYPMETIAVNGMHLLHLMYAWKRDANVNGTYRAFVEVTGGSIEIDTSCSRAYLVGQGLVGDGVGWDGLITVADVFGKIAISNPNIKAISAQVSIKQFNPVNSNMQEAFANIVVSNPKILGFSEYISFEKPTVQYLFDVNKADKYDFDRNYVSFEDSYKLITNYTFVGEEQTIDSGKLCVVKIDTDQFESVESVVIENG